MTIASMITEIHKSYPKAYTYRRMSKPYPWVVAAHDGTGKILAEARTEWRAVEAACNAIRKAQSKPMTVAQAKAIVQQHDRGATLFADRPGGVLRWRVFGPPTRPQEDYPGGSTRGQAWKAAAQHLQSQAQPEPTGAQQ